jgi:fatty-acid desaturase
VIAQNITIHKVIGYKNYVTTDQTYNWSVASLLLPGEGNHNNHHALPGAAKNKMTDRDIDTGYWYLKLIGNVPENQTYHQHFIT